MKEHETFPGKPYVVTCKAGCDITDASGELDETCEPGKQKVVYAPSEKLFTSENAVVRETFNRAALALGLLGGGVDKWGKYAKCVTVADLQAVNADYKNDLTADGEWKWKLPKLTNGARAFFSVKGVKTWNVDMPELTIGSNMFEAATALKAFRGSLPKLQKADNMFTGCSFENWDGDLPSVTDAYYMFRGVLLKTFKGAFSALKSATGVFNQAKKLQSFEGDLSALQTAIFFFNECENLSVCGSLPSLANGEYMFRLCKLNKESALRVLDSIPAYTSGSHPLTLGIHVDHKSDEEVIAAIENAEAKGWTLTVQWNGTPTTSAASTFALRRRPVWAKLGEPMEDGRPALDWGHYVTNAVENGYTEFASLEEAKEHFNITDEA